VLTATLLIRGTTPGGSGLGTAPVVNTAELLAVIVGLGTIGALAEWFVLKRYEARHGRGDWERPRMPPGSSPGHWLHLLFTLAVAIGLLIPPTLYLPKCVDAWAYVTGTESSATFVASYSYQTCTSDDGGGDDDCTTTTVGLLEPGSQHAAWPGSLSAGQKIQVSRPAWNWLLGRTLITGAGDATLVILLGFFLGGMMVFALAMARGAVSMGGKLARNQSP
jgi:hypothetical protein